MALIAKQPEQRASVEPISAGMHVAVCYAVVDLGVHFSEVWQKEQHKILLIWETDEEMVTADGEVKQKSISKEFVLSLHEKSDLYKTLISWRGRAFTPVELEGFDVKNVLGAPCLLNIVSVEKNDKEYANIGGITPLMKGQQAPELVNKKIYFELSKETLGEIDELPKWIGEKIRKSITYQELTEKKLPTLQVMDDNSDIPF